MCVLSVSYGVSEYYSKWEIQAPSNRWALNTKVWCQSVYCSRKQRSILQPRVSPSSCVLLLTEDMCCSVWAQSYLPHSVHETKPGFWSIQSVFWLSCYGQTDRTAILTRGKASCDCPFSTLLMRAASSAWWLCHAFHLPCSQYLHPNPSQLSLQFILWIILESQPQIFSSNRALWPWASRLISVNLKFTKISKL